MGFQSARFYLPHCKRDQQRFVIHRSTSSRQHSCRDKCYPVSIGLKVFFFFFSTVQEVVQPKPGPLPALWKFFTICKLEFLRMSSSPENMSLYSFSWRFRLSVAVLHRFIFRVEWNFDFTSGVNFRILSAPYQSERCVVGKTIVYQNNEILSIV